ncbi:MAG: ROK family protein [Propioniciclava sp.]
MSYIGIDIGGTKIAAVRCDASGNILDQATSPCPAKDGGSAMMATVSGLIRALEGGQIDAIGVGAAGVIAQGTVLAASASFSDWAGVRIEQTLADEFGLPVAAMNDVNAFLAGELRWGAAQGDSDVFGLTLGTGVGGAVVLNGKIWVGARGMAGEIGHTPGYGDRRCTCGEIGHLETRAAGRALEREYERLSGESITARSVAQRARAGDQHALAVFTDAAAALGQAVVTVANLFDILHVVVGGGVRQAWDLLGPGVAEWLHQVPSISGQVVQVSPSVLGSHGVALGAAAAAMNATRGTGDR